MRPLLPGRGCVVVGIVNRTPDSFHDRGVTFDLGRAVEAALAAEAAGAGWVDVGGCPIGRAGEVSASEEIARVVPVIDAARQQGLQTVVSVDTFRAEVAREALAAGADAVNDTSGLHDPLLLGVVVAARAGLVVTHSRYWPAPTAPRPPYVDVAEEVRRFLARAAGDARNAGVPGERIVVDPGHDLWKTTGQTLELQRRLRTITNLPWPTMVAASNKTFITDTVGADGGRAGTAAVHALAVAAGARLIRAHDVPAAVAVVRMVEAVMASG